LSALTRQHLLALMAAKAAKRAHHGLRTILIPLRAMLNAAVEDGVIPGNPALRLGRLLRGLAVREGRRATALTADELSSLLASAEATLPEYADLVHVLAWSGLRIGEACGLQWADLDLRGRSLDVKRTISWQRGHVRVTAPKSGRARRVDIPSPGHDEDRAHRAPRPTCHSAT
jgi:integrase